MQALDKFLSSVANNCNRLRDPSGRINQNESAGGLDIQIKHVNIGFIIPSRAGGAGVHAYSLLNTVRRKSSVYLSVANLI